MVEPIIIVEYFFSGEGSKELCFHIITEVINVHSFEIRTEFHGSEQRVHETIELRCYYKKILVVSFSQLKNYNFYERFLLLNQQNMLASNRLNRYRKWDMVHSLDQRQKRHQFFGKIHHKCKNLSVDNPPNFLKTV